MCLICMQQRLSLRSAGSRVSALTVLDWAGSADAKSPSAEATRAAPPSFNALAREMALLSMPIARSSKNRSLISSLI
jgi:hypothetical protein